LGTHPLGRLYVERYFPLASKDRADAMIAHLMDAYRESIATLDWMGPETRRQALDKLAAIRPMIGYPVTWRDYTALVVRRDDLVGNVMRARGFHYNFWLAKLGGEVDRAEWHSPPQTINAFYSPSRNAIVFPAGILQQPFFDAGADDAANYGAIGTVIGHEISHAFDDQGSRFDGEGNLRNWWTEEDRSHFDGKTRSLIAQYDAFSPLPGYQVNGALTLGENVADNAGVAVAIGSRLAAARRRSSTATPARSACSSAPRKSGATRQDARCGAHRAAQGGPARAGPVPRQRKRAIRVPSTARSTSSRAMRCICRRSSGYRRGRSTARWCAKRRPASAMPFRYGRAGKGLLAGARIC
jgi:predicted metalloendopeptidase